MSCRSITIQVLFKVLEIHYYPEQYTHTLWWLVAIPNSSYNWVMTCDAITYPYDIIIAGAIIIVIVIVIALRFITSEHSTYFVW